MTVDQYRDSMGPRLAVKVSEKLGITARFSHWQPPAKRGGPETPVFIVPMSHVDAAKTLLLTVVAE